MSFFNWGSKDEPSQPQPQPTPPAPAASESLRIKQEYTAYLDRTGKYYHNMDNDPTSVYMNYGGGDFCFDSLTCFIDFDPSSNGKGNNVHLYVPCVGKFPGYLRARGLEMCNQIARGKRWVRAYLDKDDDMCFDADMYIMGGNAAEDVLELVQITMSIIDDLYPEIQHAMR